MLFLAETNKTKFKLKVQEKTDCWEIEIAEDGGTQRHHVIPKTDFQKIDKAYSFLFQNASYLVDITGSGGDYTVYARGTFRQVKVYNQETLLHESLKRGGQMAAADKLVAGMPGKIVKVLVKEGETVKANQPALIMEAMKMENEMRTTHEAKVKKIHVQEGQSVEAGAALVEFV